MEGKVLTTDKPVSVNGVTTHPPVTPDLVEGGTFIIIILLCT